MGCRAIDPAAERTTKPINGPSPRGKTSLIPLTDVPGSLVQVTKPHVGAHVFLSPGSLPPPFIAMALRIL